MKEAANGNYEFLALFSFSAMILQDKGLGCSASLSQ